MPYSEMVALWGKRLVKLPAPVLYPQIQATWALRRQRDSPTVGLDFVRYPWVVDTSNVQRETGYRFRHTSREALMAYPSEKRNGERKDDRGEQKHLHRCASG